MIAALIAALIAFIVGYIAGIVTERDRVAAEREARMQRIVARAMTETAPVVPLLLWTLHPHGHLTSYSTLDDLMPRVVEEPRRG